MTDAAIIDKPRCRKCGDPFDPKRSNQLYCSPEHRPPSKTIRLTPAQADALIQIAAQLS